jgi:hypothetical protein
MLSFDRHGNFSFPWMFLVLLVILLKSDAVGECFHVFADEGELLVCLLDGESVVGIGLQTASEEVDETAAIVLACAADIEGYSVDFELCFGLVVVEFRFVEGDELEYDHADSEKIGLKGIVLDLVL